ncbi:hypothetical protein L9F63_003150 [Diploptera punctata]|uniref:Ionotropic glutamate receptor C-terminal domain-containing protein n=1 Tax=Diploptera punctata TaxID=6984 RepID=A0AAD7ZL84_DIPPU|nr:hypothetical protein L9F63_003150 [Diploptera punctata]
MFQGPATIVVKKNNEEILQIGGFIGKLWNILMNMGNFTTKYVRAEENAFGTDINGTRTGLLGMLQRKEIDVASTDILMDTSRLDIVDFIVPLFEVRTYMFTRDPENVESDWKSFLEPFSINIWLFIIGTITVLTIMLHATLTTERYIMPPDQYSSLQFKPYDGFFSILSSFCLQGQNWWLHLPESSRILVVTSYLTALVLIVGYSGFLVSYLSLRKTVLPFNTFSQFLNDGTYQLGVLNNSIHYAYFEESKDPIMIKLFKKYISNNKNDHPRSFLEGLHRICSFNRYNFMAPVFIVGGLIQQLECRITEVPQAFIPATATMGLVKNSPYQGIFSYYVKRVQRSGVLKKLRKNYLTLKLDRTLITTERHGADFESLKPLIIFLALGFVMATLVLALERMVIKKRQRIRTRRKRTQKLKQLLKTNTNENG